METAELEEALEDLETRLERLRALYEQYFLGIEKVPPAVARTDVDRRIWTLRKMQIRNTAKRYKLQTLVQRYNTYQQYWQRICREIENGTYSPHVARARRQIDPDKALTIATRRRLGAYHRSSTAPPAEDPREQAPREAESGLAAALSAPEQGSGATVDAWQDPREKTSATANPLSGPRTAGTPSPLASRRPQGAPSMPSDGEGGLPGRAPPPIRSLPGPTSLAAPTAPGALPDSTLVRSKGPPPLIRTAPGSTESPQIRTTVSAPSRTPDSPGHPGPRPPTPPKHAPSPLRPQAKEPRAAQEAPAHSPPERSSPAHGTELSAARVEQLHRQLVEAKRRNNEEPGVGLAELRGKLERAERQLRLQHGDRAIEFAVVVKNGKAMIKPTVR